MLQAWRQELQAIKIVCTIATIMWCFVPAYRRKVLVNGIDERLKVLIQMSVERWLQEFVQVEVTPDHVHLLVGCDPQCGYSSVRQVHEGSDLSHVTPGVS